VPVGTVRPVERVQVELVDHVEDEPGQVAFRQPVTQVPGQQEGLVAVATQKSCRPWAPFYNSATFAPNASLRNRVLLGHRPTMTELPALPSDLLGQGGHLGEESGAAYRVGSRRRVAGQLVILGGDVDHHSLGHSQVRHRRNSSDRAKSRAAAHAERPRSRWPRAESAIQVQYSLSAAMSAVVASGPCSGS
jgi:hypothetical protein